MNVEFGNHGEGTSFYVYESAIRILAKSGKIKPQELLRTICDGWNSNYILPDYNIHVPVSPLMSWNNFSISMKLDM
jgi:hypothetical protein